MNHGKARTAPEWLRNGVIYQINLRAFTPEGTLNAAKTKLEHIRSCGATVVYLMPVFYLARNVAHYLVVIVDIDLFLGCQRVHSAPFLPCPCGFLRLASPAALI